MRKLILIFLLAAFPAILPALAQDFELHPEREREEVTEVVSEAALDTFESGAKIAVEQVKEKPVQVAAADKAPTGGRKITVRAYAYCLYGRTASGTYVKHGTIAVDPRVIPMGSKIYVPGYGWGKALDTGGAIKGNKIDLWMPNSSQCYSWGVRQVTITVFD